MLKAIQKEVENLRIKVYSGLSTEDTDTALYEIEQMLFKAMDKQLNLTDVVHTLKDCFIAQKPVEYNGKKYYVSKLDIMQNGDEFCDLIDIETYDCIDDIKSTEVKIF